MDMNNHGQINLAYDNATINAVQIINYNTKDRPPKIMTLQPIPSDNYVFQGIEETIIDKLENNKVLFLNGIGGIGKTTTAKKIFEVLKSKYDYLAWIEYQDNWQYSLVNGLFTSYFHFDNKMSENERYKKIVEFLTNLQETADGKHNKIAIFIDNFNKIESGELSEIRRLPAHILITTRCDIPNIEKYTLETLNTDLGRQLFMANYGPQKKVTYRDEKAIEDIVSKSHGYPLAIELIARAISYKNIHVYEFLENLIDKDYEIGDMQLYASSDWNGKYVHEEITKQISKVYQLSDLNEREVNLIKIISILPANHIISIEDIQHCVDFNCSDTIIALYCRGWIKQSENGILMHEVICECIYQYNYISYMECKMLLDFLQLKTEVSSSIQAINSLKYAEYSYNIIIIMKSYIDFCRHLFLREAALIFKEVGKYDYSRSILDIIINAYDEKKQDDILILAELYNNYSKTYSIEGNISKAFEKSKYAEELIDSITTDKTENFYLQLMVIKKTVAMHYAHQKLYEQAFVKMQDALNCVDFITERNKYHIVNLYSDYSMLLSEVGDMEGSIAQYENVLKHYDICGVKENNPWRYTTYTNLAESLIYDEQFAHANNYEFQALVGKYQIYREDNLAIANALLGMGHIYRSEKHLWDIAQLFYKKALDIFQKNVCSDGYCDSLAGLSIVMDDVSFAIKAYDIMITNSTKLYLACTYANVMFALLKYEPLKVITLGIQMLSGYSKQPKPHTAIQYIYALMGQASLLLGNKEDTKKYLNEAIETRDKHSMLFYRATQRIIDEMPSLKD